MHWKGWNTLAGSAQVAGALPPAAPPQQGCARLVLRAAAPPQQQPQPGRRPVRQLATTAQGESALPYVSPSYAAAARQVLSSLDDDRVADSSSNSGTVSSSSSCEAAAADAVPPTTSSSSSSSGNSPAIRLVAAADYWAVADVHCAAFYPKASGLWGPLLRLDRVASLQGGRERRERRGDCVACLVASVPPCPEPSASSSSTNAAQAVARSVGRAGGLGPLVGFFAALVLPPELRRAHGTCHVEEGVEGAVVVDTCAEFLPTRRKLMPNGLIRVVRREGIAYLSNLAVSPAARRRGVARLLVEHAEAVAAGWGCRSVALHVDPTNTAAVQLYERAGYRAVMYQPEWQRLLEGRRHALVLMLRVLPSQLRGAAAAEAAAASAEPQEEQQPQLE